MTLAEVAGALGVGVKTARRELVELGAVYITAPVHGTPKLWSLPDNDRGARRRGGAAPP
jgi:hypothetical protein